MITGGPLHLGDIEDLGTDDDCHITCPWHAFRYSLTDGTSPEDEDHEATIFETRVVSDGLGGVEVCLESGWSVGRVEWISEPGTVESLEGISQALENTSISTRNGIASKERMAQQPETLAEWASLILRTPDAQEKVALTHKVASMWNSGEIEEVSYLYGRVSFNSKTYNNSQGWRW